MKQWKRPATVASEMHWIAQCAESRACSQEQCYEWKTRSSSHMQRNTQTCLAATPEHNPYWELFILVEALSNGLWDCKSDKNCAKTVKSPAIQPRTIKTFQRAPAFSSGMTSLRGQLLALSWRGLRFSVLPAPNAGRWGVIPQKSTLHWTTEVRDTVAQDLDGTYSKQILVYLIIESCMKYFVGTDN